MNNLINIILADDEELFRKGISFILRREINIDVIFEVSNGSELLDYLSSDNKMPDIILMDLKMPSLNGVEATKIIHNMYPNIKIIALTSYNTNSFIANMIQVGAASYLVKNTTPKEMINTINEVFNNGFFYNDNVLQVIKSGILPKSEINNTTVDENFLSNREKEILQLICLQLSSNEIGEKLFISSRTVEGHRNRLFVKTKSKNIAGLVVYAIQNNIIDVDFLSL